MDKNTIKKELYKQKTTAEVDFNFGDYIHYSALLIIDGIEEEVNFEVPITEAPNENVIPAQLLIPWLV